MAWSSELRVLHKQTPVTIISVTIKLCGDLSRSSVPGDIEVPWNNFNTGSHAKLGLYSPNLAKSRSREIGCYNYRIALKFDRHLGSTAAEVPVNFRAIGKMISPTQTTTARKAESTQLVVLTTESSCSRHHLSISTHENIQQIDIKNWSFHCYIFLLVCMMVYWFHMMKISWRLFVTWQIFRILVGVVIVDNDVLLICNLIFFVSLSHWLILTYEDN